MRDVNPAARTKSGSTLPAGSTLAQINAAINAAAAGQYVELAAGTFNISGDFIISKSSITLRGQVDASGNPTTILNFTSGKMSIRATGWDFSNASHFTTIAVNSGATRGSTSITLASAPTGLSAGRLLFISAPKNAPTIDGGGWTDWFGGRPYSTAVKVTGVSGNTVTFAPPLNADYLSGAIQAHYRAASAQIDYVGLENLSFTASGGYFGSTIIQMEGANQSWVKNCKFTGVGDQSSLNAAIYWYCSFGGEMTDSEVFDARSFGSSTYGIASVHSHALLIVNNYFHHLPNVFPIMATGGSVFAYNYFTDEPYQSATWLSQIVFFHGSHSHYNLFEGNWVPTHYNDDTAVGNFSHSRNSLYVRQRMLGWDATGPKDNNTNAITLTNHHDNVTVAACVMGHTGTQNVYNGNGSIGGSSIFNVHSVSDATLLRLGNYNTVNNGIPAVETTALGGGAVATSYLYSSKPAWFGNLPWPWLDPANYAQSNNPQNLPAGYRAAHGVPPPTTSSPCDQTLSVGANIVSAVSSAVNGSTLCLNSGNYGTVNFTDLARTGPVTLMSSSGTTVQMSPRVSNSNFITFKSLSLTNMQIQNCSTNIQVLNNVWVENTPGLSIFDYGFSCPNTNKQILIEGNTLVNTRPAWSEGKIGIVEVNGVTLRNNRIEGQSAANGGDGIQTGGSNNNLVIGPGNIFRNIRQAPCDATPEVPHCDAIQYVGSCPTCSITGNWFDNVEVVLQHHDAAVPVVFTDNLVTGAVQFWAYDTAANNSRFDHNTIYNLSGFLTWGRNGSGVSNSSGILGRSNLFWSSVTPLGCTGTCAFSHNLAASAGSNLGTNQINATPIFTGGSVPSTWAGWQLAAGSPGKNAGHDGLDVGTSYFGAGSSTPPSGSVCDVNSDSSTTVSDVQLCANQAIGLAACTTGDINQDSTCNVIDVQRVVNAALGGVCVTP